MHLFLLLHHSNVLILKYPKEKKTETKKYVKIHTQTSGGKKQQQQHFKSTSVPSKLSEYCHLHR